MSIADSQGGRGSVRRCHAAIIFSDICAFTQLAERCDPESLAEILTQVRGTAERVINSHQGVVNQFYGDGVLAVFGFPTPHENDVLHAAEAAIDLHKAIESLELEQYLPKAFTLQLHTGVHAGLVVVEEGDRVQGRYKMYGDALNTAARLSDAAEAGEIISSENTLRGWLPYFNTERLPPLTLKGKQGAMAAYKIIGRTDVNTRYEASVRRGLLPFIGRQLELRQLAEAAAVIDDGIRLASVIGSAGLGKTRLVEQFLDSDSFGGNTFRLFCQSDNSAVPLQPFVQLLQQVFQLDDSLSLEESVSIVEQQLKSLESSLLEFIPEFLQTLSLFDPSNTHHGLQFQPQKLAEAFAKLLACLAVDKSLCIFIDDWHWVDDLSRLVLRDLIATASDQRILIIIASRAVELSDSVLDGETIHLQPFSLEDSTRTVSSLLKHELDLGAANSIYERSGGNVLFIEELCRSLLADGQMKTSVASSARALAKVPVTLQGLIEARVARLSDEYARLVRTAAVLGNVVSKSLLERVVGYRLTDDVLFELAHQDLLYSTENEGMMRFKHGLTRDVIYQSVRLRVREQLHLQVADILESNSTKQGGYDQYEALAYHYAGSGNEEKTAYYAELAGDKALATTALDSARKQYRIALDALGTQQVTAENYSHWNSIARRYGWACVFDPAPDQPEVLGRAVELARQYGDMESIARAEYWLGAVHYSLGQSTLAIYHCEKSLEAARTLHDNALAVHVLATLGQAKSSGADYDGAFADYNEAIEIKKAYRKGGKTSASSAYSLACKAMMLGDRGLFDDAYGCMEEAKLAVRGVDSEIEGSVLALDGAVKIWQGRWQDALQSAMAAQHAAKKITNDYVFAKGRSMEGYCHWMLSRQPESLQQIMDATAWLELKGKGLFMSFNYGWLADILAVKGDIHAVRAQLARALVRVRQHDRLGEVMAYRAMAKGYMAGAAAHAVGAGFSEQALQSARHYLNLAMSSAVARGSRHEQAVTNMYLAELAGLQGRAADANHILDSACDEFEAMAMHWHREQAEQLYLRFS